LWTGEAPIDANRTYDLRIRRRGKRREFGFRPGEKVHNVTGRGRGQANAGNQVSSRPLDLFAG
jgi:hypothetical protein